MASSDEKGDANMAGAEQPVDVQDQAQQQTGTREVRVRVDEREMSTGYANAFRTNGSAEEVLLDFGLNSVAPGAGEQKTSEILFTVNQRIIMNYYSAKRLAITLSQLIRRHEQQFGELEMDVAKRAGHAGATPASDA